MTWNTVTAVSTTYNELSELANGYVLVGYVLDDYILGSDAWNEISQVSSIWTAA